MHTPKDSMCAVSNPHLSSAAGFGTLLSQVAGFHRAVPSTTLDKAGMQLLDDYSRKSSFVNTRLPLFTNPLWTFGMITGKIRILICTGVELFEKFTQAF